MPDDAELLAAHRTRSPEAFQELFDLYSDWMFGLSVSILSIRWKLKKFVLEVVTRFIEKFDEFEGCYKIGTWLDRTTHNANVYTLRIANPRS